MEQTLPRKLAQQRWTVNERRQQLAALTKLRSDLGRQLAQLDQASGPQAAERRGHLHDSIAQVERQVDEARMAVEGSMRILRRLEKGADTQRRRSRRRRPRH